MNGVTRCLPILAVFKMGFCLLKTLSGKISYRFVLLPVLFVFLLSLLTSPLLAQSDLQPQKGYHAQDVFTSWDVFSTFEVSDSLLYGNTGEQIVVFHLQHMEQTDTYSLPEAYTAFPAFLTLADDGNTLWAGFTSLYNTDDRIYALDMDNNEWNFVANFPANHDLILLNEHILVSGLNSDDWNQPSSVFLLDTTGSDMHRKIIEVGGSTAGLAADAQGNVYYATYYFEQENILYRWSSEDVMSTIDDPDAQPLAIEDAEVLSALPDGVYDCHVDKGGNLLMTINASPDKILAKWKGTPSEQMNIDTLALATDETDWLTAVKTTGNLSYPGPGNAAFALGWGRPVTKVYQKRPLQVVQEFENIMDYEGGESVTLQMDDHFQDPDHVGEVDYQVVVNSSPGVAETTLENNLLTIEFLAPGQTNVEVCATSETGEACDEFVVGVMPLIEGEFVTAHFENLLEEEESFWNGSDESGGFQSGDAFFPNHYDTEWGSWMGWAYANTTDNQTQDWSNQYSAITGSGYPGYVENHNGTYAVSFVSGEGSIIHFNGQQRQVEGFFVSNTTYAGLTMMHGDAFAKKFGGETGDDPDWFKLSITGKNAGNHSDTLDYYLADFRFDDHTKDYIIQTWQWIDLSWMGAVDTLVFQLSSSDVGEWGMNTPAYFALDQLLMTDDQGTFARHQSSPDDLSVYPNPSAGMFRIVADNQQEGILRIFNQTGQLVHKEEMPPGQNTLLDLSRHPAGTYMLTLQSEDELVTKLLIKANR